MNDHDVLFDKVLKGLTVHQEGDSGCDYCPYDDGGNMCLQKLLIDSLTVMESMSDRLEYMENH